MKTTLPPGRKVWLLCLTWLMLTLPAQAQKFLEKLNRGVVAVRTSSSQVYVGWRLFGNDPAGISFNVYRGSTKANSVPITNSTNFVDNTSTDATYSVRAVLNGVEQAGSATTPTRAQQFLKIPLQLPAGGTTPAGEAYTYSANDCSVADLDGDGDYEIVVKWDPSNAKDNSQSGYTGNVYLDAYKLSGTRLWRIDLGRNIRAGAHYTQLMVYDLDSDGKAEVAVKTADGTVDGRGAVIGSTTADYRNSSGYILSGPEFLTVFNGQTGAAMATTNYLPARGTVSSWGDNYGNRVDRFVSAIAYLDGQRPSLVMGRGYYTRLVRVAWDWRGGQLTQRWTFDSNTSGNSAYAGQGNHQLTVGDVDGDGKDEVCNGASTIDDNGRGLFSSGAGHGDALHMGDLSPDRPGQEVWQCQEEPAKYAGKGLQLRDARTGQLIFGVPTTGDVGRAMAADIDPRYKGAELWGSTGGVYSCTGQQLSTSRPSINFGLWWDGDLQRELLDGDKIDKWNPATSSVTRLASIYAEPFNMAYNNTTKRNPGVSADILGDWREEVISRSLDNQSLIVLTTTIPTTYRLPTLMHDAQYRTQIALQNSAYNQPPHPSYYLGGDMAPPPTPSITLVGGSTTRLGSSATNVAPANADAATQPENLALRWNGSASRYNVFVGASAQELELVATTTETSLLLAAQAELKQYYWRVDALYDGDEVQDGETVVGEVWSFTTVDNVPPVALAQDITVTLDATGQARISGPDVDNGSSDAYGIASRAVSPAVFTCANLGTNPVILTVTDKNGNSASAAATVTVLGSLPTAAIAMAPANAVYTGGVPTTLYLGYGPQSATLTASGGLRYHWSPAAGLSDASVAAPVFTAAAPGSYVYTVTVTNEYGCTATASVTLKVVDARCGNKNDKVLICHNGKLLCVDSNAVAAHLTNHQDQLATCATDPATEARTAASGFAAFEAYPNPFAERTTISFRSPQSTTARVQVLNALGQVVATLYDEPATAGQLYQLTLDSKTLPAGFYTCRLLLGSQIQTQKLIIEK
ncbi:rhamnogalacturonan lyase family protein [Hymenobacter cellulosivorans]|uniref:T9SS type A sorting domain-containing protein n=1 Tax=Hymenobacter cellulosivorans TaxID=2932249 RepID=A0ABY4F5A1_9BACT|nr:T9SS type A sorting domain-containing protein [Hymenobacter cellulosivorans]UOQ51212.1 T9SS type A sorting domain-containing protein [Hymenobacter cellulosivorans]